MSVKSGDVHGVGVGMKILFLFGLVGLDLLGGADGSVF